jgi:hypothetical protein
VDGEPARVVRFGRVVGGEAQANGAGLGLLRAGPLVALEEAIAGCFGAGGSLGLVEGLRRVHERGGCSARQVPLPRDVVGADEELRLRPVLLHVIGEEREGRFEPFERGDRALPVRARERHAGPRVPNLGLRLRRRGERFEEPPRLFPPLAPHRVRPRPGAGYARVLWSRRLGRRAASDRSRRSARVGRRGRSPGARRSAQGRDHRRCPKTRHRRRSLRPLPTSARG